MFPAGLAGVALFLLRVSVAATLVLDGTSAYRTLISLWVLLAIIPSALSVIAGLLTPFGSILCGLIQLALLIKTGEANSFHVAISVVNSVALALLGPGAYSVDAWLFGRQLLIIPPSNPAGGTSRRLKERGPQRL